MSRFDLLFWQKWRRKNFHYFIIVFYRYRHVDEEKNSKQGSTKEKAPFREEIPPASNYSESRYLNEHSANTHYSQPCTQYPLSTNEHCYPATDRCHYSNDQFHSKMRQSHVPCPTSAFPNESCSSERCPNMDTIDR